MLFNGWICPCSCKAIEPINNLLSEFAPDDLPAPTTSANLRNLGICWNRWSRLDQSRWSLVFHVNDLIKVAKFRAKWLHSLETEMLKHLTLSLCHPYPKHRLPFTLRTVGACGAASGVDASIVMSDASELRCSLQTNVIAAT